MKKLLIGILVAISIFKLNAQIDRGNVILSVDGMYNILNSGSGVYNNSFSEKKYSLVLGASVTFMLDKGFLLGIGLDFFNENDYYVSNLNIVNNIDQLEHNIIYSSVLLPNIYAGYAVKIMDKLYFNTNLKVSQGVSLSNIYGGVAQTNYITMENSVNSTYIHDFSAYTSAALQPEFTYFLTRKIGLSLNTGGINYSFIGWNMANSNLEINFNPSNWLFGLKILL
jgi:hypothetical protein